MRSTALTRRSLLQSTALAAVGAPFVRGANAAGKLSIGFWDHWVPGANDMLTKLCREWADREKVEITIDFITSQGDKLMLTGAAEEQARSGHDILGMPTWYAAPKAESLEPVDDLMKTLIEQNGAVGAGHEYLGKVKGHWIAVPATVGSLILPPCSRIDLFKEHVGLDLTKMYPTAGAPNKELPTGPGISFSQRPRSASRPAIRSGCRSARPAIRSTGPARFLPPTVRCWSIRRATSRSNPMPPGRCSNGSRGWCRSCRPTYSPGMIPQITNG